MSVLALADLMREDRYGEALDYLRKHEAKEGFVKELGKRFVRDAATKGKGWSKRKHQTWSAAVFGYCCAKNPTIWYLLQPAYEHGRAVDPSADILIDWYREFKPLVSRKVGHEVEDREGLGTSVAYDAVYDVVVEALIAGHDRKRNPYAWVVRHSPIDPLV